MKSSRQSSRCQRIRSISRMTLDVYLVQSLNRSRPPLGLGDDAAHQNKSPGKLPAKLNVLVPKGGGDRLRPDRSSVAACSTKYFEDEYAYISQSYYRGPFLRRPVQRSRVARFPALRPATTAKVLDRCRFVWPTCRCRAQGVPLSGTRTKAIWIAADAVGGALPFVVLGAVGCVAIFAMVS